MTELASQYGRYGYRRITALLQREGFRANHKRVERLWRREGLKVPQRQPKRGRLWFSDGSCIRHRAEHRDHVWSYDFVFERTHDGRPIRTLVVVDEFTRECLATRVARRLSSEDVVDCLADLFLHRGRPQYLRSDNGAEFTAAAVREWLARLGVTTPFHRSGQSLGERLRGVPDRQAILKQFGIDDTWRDELIVMANDLSVVTGVRVQPDDAYSKGKAATEALD